MEKVSILMPVYNGEKFLKESIDSVLRQTYSNFEFIIVNDGSHDSSLDIIKEYAIIDDRIKIITHDNKGFGESLNIGLEKCDHELVVRIDQDDIMLPNRIERQLLFLEKNRNIAVVSCLAHYVNEDDKIIGKSYSDVKSIEDCENFLKKNEPIGILHPGVILKKSIVQKLGGFRGKFFPAEDIDLWNRMLEEGYYVVVMQEILMKYRISSSSEITTRFINSRKKFEWVRDSMWKRRSGESEPTWDEYLQKLNSKTFFQKLNWKRKTYAKFYFRTAGFDYARKEFGAFILHLIAATFLQPQLVLKKIIRQQIK